LLGIAAAANTGQRNTDPEMVMGTASRAVTAGDASWAAEVTRRDAILAAVGAAIAAGVPAPLLAQELTAEGFLALSERLTGASGLDPDVARTVLGGFLATGHGPGLAALADGTSDGPLADAVVAAWYSGLYDTGHGPAVADFEGALLWSALNFTKPFGDCGGETGYWADPPET
jgi:hypothetical protein